MAAYSDTTKLNLTQFSLHSRHKTNAIFDALSPRLSENATEGSETASSNLNR